jgi:orotate phosphoribosyltransferase
MVYVRSSKKEHGKENLIEGFLKKGSRVLIVEDLISTGKSSSQNITAIRENRGKVTDCVAITTSTRNAFEKAFNDYKVKLFTITDVAKTIEVALKKKLITARQKESVDLFLADPPNWARKMGFA